MYAQTNETPLLFCDTCICIFLKKLRLTLKIVAVKEYRHWYEKTWIMHQVKRIEATGNDEFRAPRWRTLQIFKQKWQVNIELINFLTEAPLTSTTKMATKLLMRFQNLVTEVAENLMH